MNIRDAHHSGKISGIAVCLFLFGGLHSMFQPDLKLGMLMVWIALSYIPVHFILHWYFYLRYGD